MALDNLINNEKVRVSGEFYNPEGLYLLSEKWKTEIVPSSVYDFEKIKTLRITNIKLNTDELIEIGNMSYLRELNLVRCGIDYLPEEFFELRNLRNLNLNVNNLSVISEKISNFKELEYLSLQENNLKELPGGAGFLDNLIFLDLWNNPIESFPESMNNLKKIIQIDLPLTFSYLSKELCKNISISKGIVFHGSFKIIKNKFLRYVDLGNGYFLDPNQVPIERNDFILNELLSYYGKIMPKMPLNELVISSLRNFKILSSFEKFCKDYNKILELAKIYYTFNSEEFCEFKKISGKDLQIKEIIKDLNLN